MSRATCQAATSVASCERGAIVVGFASLDGEGDRVGLCARRLESVRRQNLQEPAASQLQHSIDIL